MNAELPSFSQSTAQAVARELGIACEPWMQDWPFEVADSNRIEEFFAHLETESRPDYQRAVVTLIIASLDEAFLSGVPPQQELLSRIGAAIRKFPELLEYWSCPSAESNEMFAVTPWIRSL